MRNRLEKDRATQESRSTLVGGALAIGAGLGTTVGVTAGGGTGIASASLSGPVPAWCSVPLGDALHPPA
jgi:hypothetical protein